MKLNFREVWILLISTLLIMIVCFLQTSDNSWKIKLIDLGISIIATIITLVVLSQKIDSKELDQVIRQSISSYESSQFNRVDTNKAMGEAFWINLIDEMDSTESSVWFIGNSLKLWLATNAYKSALEAKFINRMLKCVNNNNIECFETYILLTDPGALNLWDKFINQSIDKAYRALQKNTIGKVSITQTNFVEKIKKKIVLKTISSELARQSIVLCGTRLVVTLFNSKAEKSEDSPTLDIKYASGSRNWFLEDLNNIKDKILFNQLS